MSNSLSPSARVASSEEPKLSIRISAVIEREFKRRGVFPELRIDSAIHVVDKSTGVHQVGLCRARELLADAVVQKSIRDIPHGIRVAYVYLSKNLGYLIDQTNLPAPNLVLPFSLSESAQKAKSSILDRLSGIEVLLRSAACVCRLNSDVLALVEMASCAVTECINDLETEVV